MLLATRILLASTVFILAVGWPWRSFSQEGGASDASSKDKSSAVEITEPPRRIEESHPTLYYLKDKQGNLQAVPNFTLEDFEELYKLKHQLVQGDRRPRYSLQQMLASGTVNAAGQAELIVQCRVLVREGQWTRVPLRLDQAVLREPAQYQGPGEHFVAFEGEGEGYVAWIRGPANQTHHLTLKLLVPLNTVGQDTRLRLQSPRATASELKLKVPIAKALAAVSEGATLQTPRSGSRETELIAVGLSGDFELRWRSPDVAPGKPASLEVFGVIASRLDGRGMEADATFSVRSYGEAFDRFHIRLPADTEFIAGSTTGYTINLVNDGRGGRKSAQGLVEVQLARRTVGPVEIRFSVKRAADSLRTDNWYDLAGYEVPEAARQWGAIAVSVAGDWQILWGASRGVRQIEQPPEALRQKDVVAAYEYFAQPSSLAARLTPRKTRIGVDPEYIVFVDNDQLRLEARLRYTVRGAKVAAVKIAMPDWLIDEVGPDNLVAVDAVSTGATGPVLSLPLLTPTNGQTEQFEIRLKAHRSLPPQAKSFSFALPQPQTSGPAAAVVAVLPADNVEIVPDQRKTVGLLRQQSAVPLELPARQQEPLFYRTDAPEAVFTAELRRHQQRITANVISLVTLDAGGPRVEQKLSYAIAYEPTDYFLLEVPRELVEKGRLEVSYEGRALVPVVLGDEGDDVAKPLRMRVGLPRPCIGRCDLAARYTLPAASTTDAELHVPLLMPLEAELAGNTVTVAPGPEQQVEVVAGDWSASDAGVNDGALPRTRAFSASGPSSQILLKLHGDGNDAAVLVQRAWLQTCLPQSAARQDQLVIQFTTRRQRLDITLPSGTLRAQAMAELFLLDGQGNLGKPLKEPRIIPRFQGDRVLTVPLPASSEPGRFVLRVSYRVDEVRAGRGPLKLDLPHLGDDAWVSRMYWELFLPLEEHLVSSPRDLNSEYVWYWNRFYLGRRPVMEQSDLASWVGLPGSDETPAIAGMNRYLFSSLGWCKSCEFVTLGRTLLVLLASGLVLLAGLLLIYLPAARHPLILLAATVGLAGTAVLYPQPALIAAQAAVVGLVLTLLALLLRHWTTAARPPAPAEVAGSTTLALSVPRSGEPSTPLAASVGSSRATVVPQSTDQGT